MGIFLVLFNKFQVCTKINVYIETSYYYNLNNNKFTGYASYIKITFSFLINRKRVPFAVYMSTYEKKDLQEMKITYNSG